DLRHTAYKQEDLLLDQACPQLAQNIYRELRRCAIADDKKAAYPAAGEVTQWSQELLRLKPLLTLADKLATKLHSTTNALAERDAEFYKINHLANLRDQTIHDLHQILNNLRADLERQHRVVLDQIDALDVQRQQLKDLTEISATQSAQLATQA